ncbi:hypothetical protein WN943_004231 [Citrus x changshan-huyou]
MECNSLADCLANLGLNCPIMVSWHMAPVEIQGILLKEANVLNLVRGKETPLNIYHSGIQNEVGSWYIGQQQILENVMWLHSFNKKNRAVIPIKFINVDCYSLIKPELSN